MSCKSDAEPRWFWLPTDLIDMHLDFINLRGLGIYVYLARFATRGDYPTKEQLRKVYKLSEKAVVDTLEALYASGLLSLSDMTKLLPERYTNVVLEPNARCTTGLVDR